MFKNLAVLSVVLVLLALPADYSTTEAAASEYFPEVLSCGSWPDPLIPSPDLLGQAAPTPPTPLLTESFESLANSSIAPKWLPSRFDDAVYLEHGEGAYRALTAHMCTTYERLGGTVTLKGFAGRLVMILEPMPVGLTPDARTALLAAAQHVDPCTSLSPYEDKGVPPAVAAMFAAVRDEVLAADAHPASEEDWCRRLETIGMVRGGLELSYSPKRAISGRKAEDDCRDCPYWSTVRLWTDGTVLTVIIGGNYQTIVGSGPYKELQPVEDIAMAGLHVPYVSRIMTKGEWTNASGELVATQQLASHERIYFVLGNGAESTALVPCPATATRMEQAAWLCLARSSVVEIAGLAYPYWINHQGSASPGDVIEHLRVTQARHLAALSGLEHAPCPTGLSDTRRSLLSLLQVSTAIWDVALPKWESALSGASEEAVDWEALRTSVNNDLASNGLPVPPVGWDWGECWETLDGAEGALDIKTYPPHGG